MEENQVLIVYEENPEHLSFFVIPISQFKAIPGLKDTMDIINGKKMNVDKLSKREELAFEKFFSLTQGGGILKEFLQDLKEPFAGNIVRVYHTTFVM